MPGNPDLQESVGESNEESSQDFQQAHEWSTFGTNNRNIILLVGADGVVLSELDRGWVENNPFPDELAGVSIDTLWPGAAARELQENIRRVLRDRQVRSIGLTDSSRGRTVEIILVGQGRERVLLIARDLSSVHGRISRLEKLAYTDETTGLPNREWVLAELQTVTERLNLQSGRAAIVCMEFDKLDIASELSTQVTLKDLLSQLADRIKAGLRGTNRIDEADHERYSLVGHIDTTGFAIILPVIETGEDAIAVAERLTRIVERPIEVDGNIRHVTVATGISLYPQDGRNAEELLNSAVTAMNDAKNSLSARQKFYSGTVKMRALDKQDLELELQSALENEEFALSYLPIINRDTDRVHSAEALLRWPSPFFGNKPVSELVSILDYTGLIIPIGDWVFRSAARQLLAWRNGEFPDMRIAVNVSAQEFGNGKLVERTRHMLEETGIEPESFIIEITEHQLFRDAMKDFPVCTGLKDLGVGLSVNNYGTGICSFDHLARSPVSSIKINLKFVAQVSSSPTGRSACAAITAMAHELGLEVVAEGVETGDQVAAIKQIGCDYLQGFYFCKPLAAEDLAKYMVEGAG